MVQFLTLMLDLNTVERDRILSGWSVAGDPVHIPVAQTRELNELNGEQRSKVTVHLKLLNSLRK